VIADVTELPRYPLDRFKYEKYFPRIKLLLHTPSKVTTDDFQSPRIDGWRRSSLTVFKPVNYHVLESVVKSTSSARAFYDNLDVREEAVDMHNLKQGAYIPERISNLSLKKDGILRLFSTTATTVPENSHYGHLLDPFLLRIRLHKGGERETRIQALRSVIRWAKDARDQDREQHLKCHSTSLPVVMQAVSSISPCNDAELKSAPYHTDSLGQHRW
jgi:hypothetical protein